MPRSIAIAVLIGLGLPCLSFVSTNVPLGHWSYDAIDKLAGQGLIDGAMLSTRPLSRLEMARHIAEACERADEKDERNPVTLAIIERCKKEFQQELMTMGTVDGAAPQSYFKPLEDPYVKYLYAQNKPDIENIRGDEFDKASNWRAGFASRATLYDTLAFYAHPEYAGSSDELDRDIKLIEGYGSIGLGKLEIEVGKDSLWWGPGYHGALLMSNNAEPFKMVKVSTPQPLALPWIFRSLGPFKAVWFLAELEKDRDYPRAKLTGLRVHFKPHPAVELGLLRAILFGGEGRPGLSAADYWDIFLGTKENRPGKLDNDQLAGFDASVLLPVEAIVPAKSLKIYTEMIGEDEAQGLPSTWGRLVGAQLYDVLRTGRTDLRIEYANNHVPGKREVFYHHHIYYTGYTYRGRTIGHYMGSDSRDLLIRATHYLTENTLVGAEYNKETSGLSDPLQPSIERVGFDATFFGLRSWELKTAYRYEKATNTGLNNNHIISMQVTCDF